MEKSGFGYKSFPWPVSFLNTTFLLALARPGGLSSPVTFNGYCWGRSLRGGLHIVHQSFSNCRCSVPIGSYLCEPGQVGNEAALSLGKGAFGVAERRNDLGQLLHSMPIHPQARTFIFLKIIYALQADPRSGFLNTMLSAQQSLELCCSLSRGFSRLERRSASIGLYQHP